MHQSVGWYQDNLTWLQVALHPLYSQVASVYHLFPRPSTIRQWRLQYWGFPVRHCYAEYTGNFLPLYDNDLVLWDSGKVPWRCR